MNENEELKQKLNEGSEIPGKWHEELREKIAELEVYGRMFLFNGIRILPILVVGFSLRLLLLQYFLVGVAREFYDNIDQIP